MSTLADYLRRLREQQKPQPSPVDEETEQKSEAFDYLTGRSGEDEQSVS